MEVDIPLATGAVTNTTTTTNNNNNNNNTVHYDGSVRVVRIDVRAFLLRLLARRWRATIRAAFFLAFPFFFASSSSSLSFILFLILCTFA